MKLVIGALCAVLFSASTSGFILNRQVEHNLAQVKIEIEDVMDAENWARQNGNTHLLQSLLDDRAPENWKRTVAHKPATHPEQESSRALTGGQLIQDVELDGELALVEVLVSQPITPWRAVPYRQARFFRQAESGWVETTPDAGFWGPLQYTDTRHFRFEYHQRDRNAVNAAAVSIESLYAELRRTVGLEPPQADERLTIRFSPTLFAEFDPILLRFVGHTLTTPSPLLLNLPQGMADAEAVRQSTIAPLAALVVGEAQDEHRSQCLWQPVIDGLSLWMRQTDNDLPSRHRYELDSTLRHWLIESSPPRLNRLSDWYGGCCLSGCGHRLSESKAREKIVAAGTVIDYAVASYGRGSLPLLLAGFRHHDTWQGLIPAVFSVSIDEFEAGWRGYLKRRYAQQEDGLLLE